MHRAMISKFTETCIQVNQLDKIIHFTLIYTTFFHFLDKKIEVAYMKNVDRVPRRDQNHKAEPDLGPK